jgi:putative DNA primase/helicase
MSDISETPGASDAMLQTIAREEAHKVVKVAGLERHWALVGAVLRLAKLPGMPYEIASHWMVAAARGNGYLKEVGEARVQDIIHAAFHARNHPLLKTATPNREQPVPAVVDEPSGRESALVLHRADAIAATPVEWLWPGRFALGKLSLLGGAVGTGKSNLAAALVAAVTTGGEWPCGEGRAPQGSAIMLCGEDGDADTVIPRLAAGGARPDKVLIVAGVRVASRGPEGPRRFSLHDDLTQLEHAVRSIRDVKLITIDPISSYLGRTAANSNTAVRALLEPVAALAARQKVAVIAITHPPKRASANPADQFIGSIAFTAAARASYLVARDPQDEDRRLLLTVKNNIAREAPTLAFRINERIVATHVAATSIGWEAQPVRLGARDVLAARTSLDVSAKAEGESFLGALFREQRAFAVGEIEDEARAAGLLKPGQPISQSKPLRMARLALGLQVKREGFGKGARYSWAMG